MRRRVLLQAAALAAPAALRPMAAWAQPRDLGFRVMREGSQVGTHTVRFRESDGRLEARSEMRVTVRLMGFTVFRYTYETEEAWQGHRLVSLSSRSDRNGTPGFCEARAEGGQILLRGVAGQARLPANAAPLTWWRAATLLTDVPVFDPRQGAAVQPQLRRSPAPGGGTRVALIGGEGAEILYDAAGTWVGFATTGEDGSAVRYERI
jgi:hypothetical protein